MSSIEIKDEVLKPIRWCDGSLELIDQIQLPRVKHYHQCRSVENVADAIQQMIVRGAPAIGIAAAYGFVFALNEFDIDSEFGIDSGFETKAVDQALQNAYRRLLAARPTAVNLEKALDRMMLAWQKLQQDHLKQVDLREDVREDVMTLKAIRDQLIEEAKAIHEEDLCFNYAMAAQGLILLKDSHHQKPLGVLTHCNTGSLATGGLGTALGIIKLGYREKLIHNVYITETRPWLQGSRLTAFELQEEKIPFQLMVEGAVGSLMRQGAIDWLIVGADRITANGDVANKIGTYSLAVLARAHGVKVMVAAPSTTLDFDLKSGEDIPIESRGAQEILKAAGYDLQHKNTVSMDVYNPAFDITPAEYIDYIVTEKGFCLPTDLESLLN